MREPRAVQKAAAPEARPDAAAARESRPGVEVAREPQPGVAVARKPAGAAPWDVEVEQSRTGRRSQERARRGLRFGAAERLAAQKAPVWRQVSKRGAHRSSRLKPLLMAARARREQEERLPDAREAVAPAPAATVSDRVRRMDRRPPSPWGHSRRG